MIISKNKLLPPVFLFLVVLLLNCTTGYAVLCKTVYSPAKSSRDLMLDWVQYQRQQKLESWVIEGRREKNRETLVKQEQARPVLERMLIEIPKIRPLHPRHAQAIEIVRQRIVAMREKPRILQKDLFNLSYAFTALLSFVRAYDGNVIGQVDASKDSQFFEKIITQILNNRSFDGTILDVYSKLDTYNDVYAQRPEVIVITFENIPISLMNSLVAQGIFPIQIVTTYRFLDGFGKKSPAYFFTHDLNHYMSYIFGFTSNSRLQSRYNFRDNTSDFGKLIAQSENTVAKVSAWRQSLKDPRAQALVDVFLYMLTHELSLPAGHPGALARALDKIYITGDAKEYSTIAPQVAEGNRNGLIEKLKDPGDLLGSVPRAEDIQTSHILEIAQLLKEQLEYISQEPMYLNQ